MIHSDWHIHTTASYDASLPLETLIMRSKEQGLHSFGITDHANFNDPKFLRDAQTSSENFRRLRHLCPEMVLGIELTPIEKPQFDYIALHGTREGYEDPHTDTPFGIELALTKEQMKDLGIRYAVGASHWRVDGLDCDDTVPFLIKEWHRQQLLLIADERVTVLGHPWYHGEGVWYGDFSVIPKSIHDETAAALLQYGKKAECNVSFFTSIKSSELFRHQYAEFLRFLFEKGVKITYGSDCHGVITRDAVDGDYPDNRHRAEKYLKEAGFRDGDFYSLQEEDFFAVL